MMHHRAVRITKRLHVDTEAVVGDGDGSAAGAIVAGALGCDEHALVALPRRRALPLVV